MYSVSRPGRSRADLVHEISGVSGNSGKVVAVNKPRFGILYTRYCIILLQVDNAIRSLLLNPS
jgi:hypothetical protein